MNEIAVGDAEGCGALYRKPGNGQTLPME
jgi:hypothetical protein